MAGGAVADDARAGPADKAFAVGAALPVARLLEMAGGALLVGMIKCGCFLGAGSQDQGLDQDSATAG